MGLLNAKLIRHEPGFKRHIIAACMFGERLPSLPHFPPTQPHPPRSSLLSLPFRLTHTAPPSSPPPGNTGNLPLVIVTTIARSSAEVLGHLSAADTEVLAVAYVMLGLIVSIALVPTVGFNLLAKVG